MDLPDLPKTEAAIIAQTNSFRAENKLGALTSNPALMAAAQSFADFLARNGKFGHEADGRKHNERIRAAGYRYCVAAENLALNQHSNGFKTEKLATDAVKGWINSPPHRAAMLHPFVTETGVGIAQGPDSAPKFISVQLFGRPETFKYEFKIENRTQQRISYRFHEADQVLDARTEVTTTDCLPGSVTFDLGHVKSTFEAADGIAFVVDRRSDGLAQVAVERLGRAGALIKNGGTKSAR
ncbi:MAG: CAP domain-containing protein [Hyphomicrobiaceae bacterium]